MELIIFTDLFTSGGIKVIKITSTFSFDGTISRSIFTSNITVLSELSKTRFIFIGKLKVLKAEIVFVVLKPGSTGSKLKLSGKNKRVP